MRSCGGALLERRVVVVGGDGEEAREGGWKEGGG